MRFQASLLQGSSCRARPRLAPGPGGYALLRSLATRRSHRAPCAAAGQGAPHDPSSEPAGNPLEALRSTRDPRARAALMQQLDGGWRTFAEAYRPTDVEAHLAQELGVAAATVMHLAIAQPALCELSLQEHVRPAVRSLKAAGLAPDDIFFLISKRMDLLRQPLPLERWLDFLSLHELSSREQQAFLLGAPGELLTRGTLHEAGQVVAYVRALGVRAEHMGPRLLCAVPALLLRSVDGQLRPLVGALMCLGLEAGQVGTLATICPELLMQDVEERVKPFIAFLRRLGATSDQVASMLLKCPQMLRADPEAAFGGRLAALRALGCSDKDVEQMVCASTTWLIAPGGIGEQVDWLLAQGLTKEQVRRLVVAEPRVLSEKPHDLDRKMSWLADELGGSMRDALAAPPFLGSSLMQCIGPRYAFVTAKMLQVHLLPLPGSRLDIDLAALVAGEDPAFCEATAASINEYEGFRSRWEEEYTASLSRDAAEEFQLELKRLGIYEGS